MKTPTPDESRQRRLFSFADAAFYLGGISERKMKEIGGPNGVILSVPIGNRRFFDKVDLDAYIDRLKAAS